MKWPTRSHSADWTVILLVSVLSLMCLFGVVVGADALIRLIRGAP